MVIGCLIFGHLSNAQLANTSWSGYFNIPDPTKMIVEFKVDTANRTIRGSDFAGINVLPNH